MYEGLVYTALKMAVVSPDDNRVKKVDIDPV